MFAHQSPCGLNPRGAGSVFFRLVELLAVFFMAAVGDLVLRGAVRPRTTPLPLGVVGLPVVAWFLIGDFFGGFF
jgi:hypothetical protein